MTEKSQPANFILTAEQAKTLQAADCPPGYVYSCWKVGETSDGKQLVECGCVQATA